MLDKDKDDYNRFVLQAAVCKMPQTETVIPNLKGSPVLKPSFLDLKVNFSRSDSFSMVGNGADLDNLEIECCNRLGICIKFQAVVGAEQNFLCMHFEAFSKYIFYHALLAQKVV